MTHQRALQAIAAAPLTDAQGMNAARLLARTDAAGYLEISISDLAALFGVTGRATVRKYLGRLREVGLIDYRLGRESAAVWFLAWARTDPPAARTVPGAYSNRPPSGAARANGSAGPAAPWDR